jgi:hypothetical protein
MTALSPWTEPEPADWRVTLIPNLKHPWDECSHLCASLWMTVDDSPQRVDTEALNGGRRKLRHSPSTSVHGTSDFQHSDRPHAKPRLTSESTDSPQFPHHR